MALEFHILRGFGSDFKDFSSELVAFEETEYNNLISVAIKLGLPLLSGMKNYYGEYRLDLREINTLIQEINKIINSTPPEKDQISKLHLLKKLLEPGGFRKKINYHFSRLNTTLQREF